MNPWAILGGVVICAACFIAGMRIESNRRDAQLLEAQQAAVKIKDAWSADIARQKQEQADEVARINGRLSDALVRLRDRPDRMPEPSRKACEGASGRELSRQDAEFLERLAAEADQQREALSKCYAWIDAVKSKKD